MSEDFVNVLILGFVLFFFAFIVSSTIYFDTKTDESKLNEIRYCPSCGIDLIEGH